MTDITNYENEESMSQINDIEVSEEQAEDFINPAREITGAYVLIDTLVRFGTKFIFGYPGGAILPLYDELYHWEEQNLIKHILVRHEQAAVHAADAYSRSTGNLGVCFATSGPGATNLVTGIATAQMDSIPLLAITGQVGTTFLGTDAFQETDIFGITIPIVKHSYLVKEADQLAYVIPEAIYIAKNGRPGPVLIDIPKDVGLAKLENPNLFVQMKDIIERRPHFRFQRKIDPLKIKYFYKLYQLSLRPLFYVGGGIISANAQTEFAQLLKIIDIPVTTTLMGKGALDAEHPSNLGMLGMHGTAPANYAVSHCDFLITLGARFDDRVTGKVSRFAPDAVIVHVDVDPAEFSKNKLIHLPIKGNVKTVIQYMIHYYLQNPSIVNPERRQIWANRIEKWKERYPLLVPDVGTKLSPQYVIKNLSDNFPDAIYATDVGQHQMWCAQFLQLKPRHWLSSAGLGTMGYGLPAAIGAQVQDYDKTVICVSGDASIQMNIQEFGTLAQYKIPVILVIVNNGWQGMVRQWQEAFYGERYSHSNMEKGAPDFVSVAASYGLEGANVTNINELENIFKTIKTRKKEKNYAPLIINCAVIEDENCYPMVKPGSSNATMLGMEKEPPAEIKKREQELDELEKFESSS